MPWPATERIKYCCRYHLSRAYLRLLQFAGGAGLDPLFDRQFYLEHYPDVIRSGIDPAAHFLLYGARESRQPHPMFDTAYYLAANPDVAAAGLNPLLQFLRKGWKEGRLPNPLFDPNWYAARYGLADDVNPLLDYARRRAAREDVLPRPPLREFLREFAGRGYDAPSPETGDTGCGAARMDPAIFHRFAVSAARLRRCGRPVILAISHSLGGGVAEYLRHRETTLTIRGLVLYVPLRHERAAAARALWIDPARVQSQLYGYDDRDRVAAIDLRDAAGNAESNLPPCRRPEAPNTSLATFTGLSDDVDRVEQSDGSTSLRIRGLEFARSTAGKLTAGIARRSRCSMETVAAMAREIARVRDPETEDRQHPLYAMNPEGWLESQIRAHPDAVDASLRSVPIYGQAPVCSAGDRGIIDLLAIDHTGRLVVIEIKASADLQLPFQALDYWMRVRKHLEAGDFQRLGYFPGQMIRPEPPRILLVAPALEFHSTIDSLIGYLNPSIEFLRVGLAGDWRKGLRVMFRLRGSERP